MRLRSFAKIWAQSRNIFECSDSLGHLCTPIGSNKSTPVPFTEFHIERILLFFYRRSKEMVVDPNTKTYTKNKKFNNYHTWWSCCSGRPEPRRCQTCAWTSPGEPWQSSCPFLPPPGLEGGGSASLPPSPPPPLSSPPPFRTVSRTALPSRGSRGRAGATGSKKRYF